MKRKLLLICFLIIIFTILIFHSLNNNYFIESEKFLNNTINSEINEMINMRIATDIQNKKLIFEEMISYDYLNNGRISAIKVNSSKLNLIANDIAISIQEVIRDSENQFGIPLTNIIGSKFFSGRGPKLSVVISRSGAVDYKIESQLISGGINQTIHRITLIFKTEINCMVPFQSLNTVIKTTLIISETMISGEIPEIILPSVR